MKLVTRPERADGVRVLHGSGEVDVTAVPLALPALADLVDGARDVVLDLREVTFFDSAGVRLVDRLAQECSRRHASFHVVAPDGSPARHVLELVGLAAGLAVEDLPAPAGQVGPTE